MRNTSKAAPVFLLTFIFIILQMSFVFIVSPACAKEENLDELNRLLEPVSKTKSETGLVVMPIPFSNPTIGTGLGAAAMYLYPMGENAPPSFTALGGLYTDTGTWGVGITQKTYLKDDKYRINGTLAYYDATVKFYGVGNDAGSEGRSILLNQVGYIFVPDVLIDIGGNFLVGPRYRLLQMETSLPDPPSGVVPPDETVQVITSSGLGLVIDYDSRDNQFYPYRGAFLDFVSMFNDDSLCSDLDYQTYKANYNIYSDIGENMILAFQVAGCGTGEMSPIMTSVSSGTRTSSEVMSGVSTGTRPCWLRRPSFDGNSTISGAPWVSQEWERFSRVLVITTQTICYRATGQDCGSWPPPTTG